MRLKRLELCGFKSFATRTVLDFGDGIVAVIGPNGSGKSNVADAIRWVMGEQSFSALRAKTSEDVIFAGGGGRARMGVAEALITLDNSSGALPLDYSEVVVGRRAYRSGQNEYLLNGAQVRYRDVVELLGGAGLARSQYTVIGQGMADAALSLRPDARRSLFEEAAGIAPHLRKRDEALRRIDEAERNLERVRDILQELAPRARTLARQAERAEEYHTLRRELQTLQRTWYGYQWQRRRRAVGGAEEALRARSALLEAQRAQSEGFSARLADVDERRRAQARRLDELDRSLSAMRAEAQRLERELAVGAERARLHEQQREAVAADADALRSRRAVLCGEIDAAREELAQHGSACAAAQADLRTAQERLASVDAVRREVEREVTRVEGRLNRLAGAIGDRRARAEQLAGHCAALERDRESTQRAVAELEGRVASLRTAAAELEESASSVRCAREARLARLAELEREVADARKALEDQEATVARLERRCDELSSRWQLLARLRQEMTGYHPGVRAVLSDGAGLGGLLGTVASLMRVPERVEEAIESALGSRLQNVVAETWADAAAAIDYLKRRRRGWATFLPLDTVRPRPPLRLDGVPGVVGVGSDLVGYDERLEPVFRMLLGQVVVVEDLDTARRLLGGRVRASLTVTLDGETVQPTGAVSGGTRQRSTNLLAQERERQVLPGQIVEAKRALAGAQRAADEGRDALEGLRRQASAVEAEARRLRAAAEAAQRALSAGRGDLAEAERELRWRMGRLEEIGRELDDLAQQGEGLGTELGELEAERERLVASARQLRRRLAEGDDEALRRRTGELETRVAVLERTVQSQQTLLDSHRRNLDDLDRQIAEKEALDGRLAHTLAELGEEMGRSRRAAEALEGRLQGARAAVEPAREGLARLEAERRELEEERARVVQRLHEAELAENRASLERDRARDDLAALAEEIEANLGPIGYPDGVVRQLPLSPDEELVELPSVDAVPAGLGDQVRQVRARLRRLGNVNPDAPHEYRELQERRTFLDSQERDLREAISSLRTVIDELDRVIEQDLGRTIRVVDDAFGDYFRRLFGGGTARLVLTDPENLSTTGVDIVAHPPGKRAQNLALLSGGERALTAVALLFALLKANPVPFCCLDEVDAALDEVNVQRFRALLEEHSRHTQFVVITHNRRTIEAAETIYGISMSERGVSQTISLRLSADGNGRAEMEPLDPSPNGDGAGEPG